MRTTVSTPSATNAGAADEAAAGAAAPYGATAGETLDHTEADAVRAALRERGYVVLHNVIDPAAIARARAHLEMAVDAHLEQAAAAGAVPDACVGLPLETRLARAYDQAGPDAAPVSWVAQTKSSFVFQQLLFRDATLCRLMEQITGRPPCLAPRFNVRSKVPGSAAVSFPWHQDHAFFRWHYLLKRQPVRRLLAVWAPLLPTDANNGVLSLEAGSHAHGFVPHRRVGGFLAVPPEAEPAGEGEAPLLCPGDVVIFTDLTLHRSGPNCSAGVRWTADWAYELLDTDDICPPLRRSGGGAEPGHGEGSADGREELPGQMGPPSAERSSGVAVALGAARGNAEDTSPFECPVCLRLIYLPTTLHCGHSLCRGCLVACMQHAARCPECRVDLPPQMTFAATSYALHKALGKLYPSEYAAREAEDAAAPTPTAGPSTGHTSLPLFVLEPLLPRQRMQLHVFEPRYTALTRRVMAGDRTFGMVALAHDHGLATGTIPRAAPVGVLVRVLDCRPLSHGGFIISIEGVRRFRTLRTWDVDGYSVAQVAWLADEPVTELERRIETTLLGAELSAMLDEWEDEVRSLSLRHAAPEA